MQNQSRPLAAEFIGTAFLLATVVGSGVMAERLAGGNVAIALLGNTIPTGAILVVLITMLGPISGAHFNPAVTLIFRLRGEIATTLAIAYVAAQIAGGVAGVWAAHLMFEEQLFQFSAKARTGGAQWFAEGVATFGLIFTILAPSGPGRGRANGCRPLHHRRLLVHGLDQFCKPRSYHRAQFFGYVRRDRPGPYAGLHRRATGRGRRRAVRLPVAAARLTSLTNRHSRQ